MNFKRSWKKPSSVWRRLFVILVSPYTLLLIFAVTIIFADCSAVKHRRAFGAEVETTTPDSAKDESPEKATEEAKDSTKPEDKLSQEELDKQQEEKRLREINDENYALYQLLVDTID